jgi:hypothetical protein
VTKKSERTLREEQRHRAQVQELADHLINALSELKKTRDEELRRRFHDEDEDSSELPISLPSAKSAPEATQHHVNHNNQYHHNGEHLPHLVPSGQTIKYQSSSGEVISVPRFGHYTGMDSSSDSKVMRRRDQVILRRKKPQNESLTGINPGLNSNSEDVLQNVITTTKCSTKDSNLHNMSKGPDSARQDDSSGLVCDGFQAIPIGKPRHRSKRGSSPPVSEQPKGIPQISGKSVNKFITTNRIL